MTHPAVRRTDLRFRDLLAVPFACLRVPLNAVDRHVVHRLDPRSGGRTVFDCAVGTVDILAGHLLDEPSMTDHGMDRVRAALHRRPGPAQPAAAIAEGTAVPVNLSS